jgi:hypothetical protein
VSEYAAFINAVRAGRKMRERMFDTLEERHAHDLRSGDDGKRLYEDLLSAVRDSGDPQAAEEFECRFFPFVDPDNPSREAEMGPGEEITKEDGAEVRRRGGGWSWVSAACVAAIALGALLLGFNGLRMKTGDQSTLAGSSVPAAHATVPSDTVNEAAPEAAAEAPIPSEGEAETETSGTVTPAAGVPAAEPELNPER